MQPHEKIGSLLDRAWYEEVCNPSGLYTTIVLSHAMTFVNAYQKKKAGLSDLLVYLVTNHTGLGDAHNIIVTDLIQMINDGAAEGADDTLSFEPARLLSIAPALVQMRQNSRRSSDMPEMEDPDVEFWQDGPLTLQEVLAAVGRINEPGVIDMPTWSYQVNSIR